MRFTISRTSSEWDDLPHPDAIKNTAADADQSNRQWVIDVADLDALVALADDDADIIVRSPEAPWRDYPHIEIYDGVQGVGHE